MSCFKLAEVLRRLPLSSDSRLHLSLPPLSLHFVDTFGELHLIFLSLSFCNLSLRVHGLKLVKNKNDNGPNLVLKSFLVLKEYAIM